MRYTNTPITKSPEGRSVYKTTFYPKIPIRDTDKFIYISRGQRIDSLAYKYYGDSSLWWIISRANGLSGAEIQPDPKIEYRIPIEINPILAEFNQLNKSK
jgi:hypothetical protein|tara:strand:+ start:1478 stop:1777 length:300 start_codon:yes stop_codon:yes gene_type:complete